MSANNNIYNILGKLDALAPKEPTVKETAKKIYESVEAQGSILSGINKYEANLAEKFQGFKSEGNKFGNAVRKAKANGIQPGEKVNVGGKEYPVKETDLEEKAPPGMEDMVMKLKKQYPGEPAKAYATAWSIYNKKQGKTEEGIEEEVEEGLDDKVYRHKGTYGTEYQGDPEEEPSVDAPKKRGRPAKGTAPKPKNAPGVRGRPVKAPAPSFTAPKGDIFGRTTGAVPKGAKGAIHKMVGEGYEREQFAATLAKDPYADIDFRPHHDHPLADRWNGGKESEAPKYQYPKTPHGHDMDHEQFGTHKIGHKSYRDIHDPIPAKPLSSVAKKQYDPAVLESVNFSEMMRETHQTLDEILSELQSDINTFRETGACSDKLRDFMDVHRHSKRQMADEAQPSTLTPMAQASIQPGQIVYYRGKAGKVDRCEGNKCFVYTSGGDMDVWPTSEVSDKKQSMLDVLKKDATDIGQGLKGFLTGKDEVAEISQLAGIAEEKKAKRDYDGDGKIETGSQEHAGAVDKAIKKAMGKQVEECISPMGSDTQDSSMNISTNMGSDGNKSVTISASGEQAEMLMQLLQLAGVGGGQAPAQAQPAVAVVGQEEEVEEAEKTGTYRNTPDEKYGTTQQIIDQGQDLNRKKAQDPTTANPAANPLTKDKPPYALEENEAVANLGAHLMSEYESIKVKK